MNLPSKLQNFSDWYQEVVLKSGLAEYSPVKGTMIIKPYGYAIWENIQNILDVEIKKSGAKNVYFPLLIPESFLTKEAEHFSGFVPEVAWVTQGGHKKLGERLAIRPTSETIMYEAFSRWISSYRDLPLKINQWCNILRWELRPRLFLRTMEFLWQEGHTVHRTEEDANKETKRALNMYYNFVKNYLAIETIAGIKSDTQKFAGAQYTTTIEGLMADGKALQMGTSHNLGQNFAKAFGIKFLDNDGKEKYPWQTSWGVSTRLIGGIIMVHGDDRGLVLPPKIAPIQVIIIPILLNKKEDRLLIKKSQELKLNLEKLGLKVEIDLSKNTPGWKFNEWELKGVPVRIEFGNNEIKSKKLKICRRDTFEKLYLPIKNLKNIIKMLDNIQNNLYAKSKKFVNDNIFIVKSYDEFKNILEKRGGFLKVNWCGDKICEETIKEETTATIRCFAISKSKISGYCIRCGKKANHLVYFAKAY